jgi:HlyD family secretion protein
MRNVRLRQAAFPPKLHICPVKRSLLLVLLIAACRREPDGAVASGTIEVIETDVAPMQTARVSRVLPEEGAMVRAGDTLVTLVQGTLDAELDQRRARLASAEAQRRDVEAGARPAEIARLVAEQQAAEAEATRAQHELERLTATAERGDVSEQQLDNARTLARTTAGRRDAATEAVRLIREGARAERIRAARSDVVAARAAVGGAKSAVGELVLVSPVEGVVLARHAEPGEVLPAGIPAITIGDLRRPFVRVYVAAPVLPGIAISVAVALDGRKERFRGRVVAIDSKAQFTPRIALTEEERADLLFGVKVELPASDALKPGLPATVRFARPGEQR